MASLHELYDGISQDNMTMVVPHIRHDEICLHSFREEPTAKNVKQYNVQLFIESIYAWKMKLTVN